MSAGRGRVLVTGATGRLGREVRRELERRDADTLSTGSKQLDIRSRGAVHEVFTAFRPDAVIHCAAWTAVDAAEIPENIPLCRTVNVTGTANLADACRRSGARLIYISSDYVFSGEGTTPWTPESRDLRPVNVYGRSKLDAERAAEAAGRWCVVRTSWLFGEGENFVRTVRRLSRERERMRVVCDQIGAPTYTADLARLLADLALSGAAGIYHACGEGGFVSRYGLAREILRITGEKCVLSPVTTEEYGHVGAPRPLNSRLDTSKLARDGFRPLCDWRDALTRYITQSG